MYLFVKNCLHVELRRRVFARPHEDKENRVYVLLKADCVHPDKVGRCPGVRQRPESGVAPVASERNSVAVSGVEVRIIGTPFYRTTGTVSNSVVNPFIRNAPKTKVTLLDRHMAK